MDVSHIVKGSNQLGQWQWVVCSTSHTLSPDALSSDVLSPCAFSPRAPCPNGLIKYQD